MSLLIGFVLDLVFNDLPKLTHPVVWIGKAISFLEHKLLRPEDTGETKRFKGQVLAVTIVGGTFLVYSALLWLAFTIHPWIGFGLEVWIVFRMMATRCLGDEALRIFNALHTGDLKGARQWIGYLVSRETSTLDEESITKATIETVSENTIDGIVSPLFYTLLGGPALGMAYKAANTLDSMVGYKNDIYIDFGRASALLDDWLNWIPARVTGGLTVLAAWMLRLDYKRAGLVLIRDRFNHASPNSPYGEAPAAGALRIQLGGRATYFGVTYDKPTFGDPIEVIQPKHILKGVRLMYVTAGLAALLLSGMKYLLVTILTF